MKLFPLIFLVSVLSGCMATPADPIAAAKASAVHELRARCLHGRALTSENVQACQSWAQQAVR